MSGKETFICFIWVRLQKLFVEIEYLYHRRKLGLIFTSISVTRLIFRQVARVVAALQGYTDNTTMKFGDEQY